LGIDPARFEEIRRVLAHIPGGAEKAIMRGLNRAIEGARTEVIKEIRNGGASHLGYTVHPDILKNSMRIIKASPGHLTATLISGSPVIPISKFKMSHVRVPVQKGIPVKLRQKVSSEIIPGRSKEWSHAFLARMASGHLGLWTRSDVLKTKKGRTLITEKFSLSIPQMIGTSAIITEVINVAKMRLDREIDHQIQYLLEEGRKT
jgi:hypothetical protein